MKVGSLFAGIGGFDLGLERAGFDIRWQVEIDAYCQRVLAKHWPHVTRYGDIRAIDWGTIEPVDLICGGFPCQPFSLAGQRRGTADDRYLWPAMLRGIEQLQPTWVIGENVPGLVGPVLDQVLSDLEATGYDTATLAVPACAVDAWHIRQRIWILAHSRRLSNHRRRGECGGSKEAGACDRTARPGGNSINVADHQEHRWRQGRERGSDSSGEGQSEQSFQAMADSHSEQMGRLAKSRGEYSRWPVEPQLGRVAHGVPHRVDRLRGLGNAIVPQIAEWLGRQIIALAKGARG